jgi:MFS superfamily sulfate permease-like transporter
VKQLRTIFVQSPSEFWVAILTAGTVVVAGVEEGIILAIFLSLLDHTRRGYRPTNTVLGPEPDGGRRPMPVASHAQLQPGLIIYRFNHSMYYANCEQFRMEVRELVTGTQPPVSWFCIDLGAVDAIDFSAAQVWRETYDLLKQQGIRLTCVDVQDTVRVELDRYGITKLIGTQYIFGRIHEIQAAYTTAMAQSNKTS